MITMAVCDKCGKRINLPAYRKIIAAQTTYFGHLESIMYDGAKCGIDLCNECSDEFIRWVNERKQKDG